MVCLGLPKHFPLILLSFAVCPFKSVWSQSHMLSLFSGAYLDTVTRNPFQVIQLVESSKHLPVKRVSGTQNSLGTWQGSRTGIPVPVYSFDSIVLLSEETQQPLHVCSQLCLVQFGFVPPQTHQCCWISSLVRKSLMEDGNQFLGSVALVAAISLGSVFVLKWWGP